MDSFNHCHNNQCLPGKNSTHCEKFKQFDPLWEGQMLCVDISQTQRLKTNSVIVSTSDVILHITRVHNRAA